MTSLNMSFSDDTTHVIELWKKPTSYVDFYDEFKIFHSIVNRTLSAIGALISLEYLVYQIISIFFIHLLNF